jgi:hypothetical protein
VEAHVSRFGRAPVRAARRDSNEPDVIAALEGMGWAVQKLDPPAPDLLTSRGDRMMLIEIKDRDRGGMETNAPHRGKGNKLEGRMAWLTPAQVEWWNWWIAAGGRPPVIVLDAAEALAAIGAIS